MRDWTVDRVAEAAGARLGAGRGEGPARGDGSASRPEAGRGPERAGGPERVVIDSREAGPGTLFVGLPGANVDGGAFARAVLAAGAWGVLVAPEHAEALAGRMTAASPGGDYSADAAGGHPASPADGHPARPAGGHPAGLAGGHPAGLAGGHPAGPAGGHPAGVVLVADDPLAALQRLAGAWRRELGAHVIGVTGSSGKTSTKDLLLGILAPQRRTVASRANHNTEIGLPLEILAAPAGTEVLVLEMAMRGPGQIAELAAIAAPEVGVIVNVGAAHLELLGSLEAIAAAKAELIAALPAGGTAIVPANEPLLAPHRREDVTTVTFGPGGDVRVRAHDGERIEIDLAGTALSLEFELPQPHMRVNLLAAVAAARAVGVVAEGRIEAVISPGRGERRQLPGEITLIDDSYNANPVSMRAALADLVETGAGRRRVAILGDMLELGPQAAELHRELGKHAAHDGVDVLVAVGALAGEMAGAFGDEAHARPGAPHAHAGEPHTGEPHAIEPQAHAVADAAAAAKLVPALLREGDVVLVKGSRGVGLEAVCEALTEAVVV